MWLLLAVVLSIPGSVSQTWIEVKETPTLGRVGQTVKPNAVLGLWTDRSAEDAFGNPLPSKQLWDSMEPSVNVNVSLFSAGGERVDHHLLGTRPVAVKCGVVKFTDLEVNQMGEFYLQFSATYLGDEPTVNRSSTFRISFGVASALSLSEQPDGVRSNFAFQQQPVVRVLDMGGNLVEDATLAVTAALSGSSNTLLNAAGVATAVAGVARFDAVDCAACAGTSKRGLGVANPSQGVRVRFTAAGVASTISRAFDVASWPPTALAVLTSPFGDIAAAAPLHIQPAVLLRDVSDFLVSYEPAAPMVVRASLRQRAGVPDTLGGTLEVPLARGVAQFSDLFILHALPSYTLDFSFVSTVTGVTSVSSTPFNIVPGAPARLGFATDTGETMRNGTLPGGPRPGAPLVTQPEVPSQTPPPKPLLPHPPHPSY